MKNLDSHVSAMREKMQLKNVFHQSDQLQLQLLALRLNLWYKIPIETTTSRRSRDLRSLGHSIDWKTVRLIFSMSDERIRINTRRFGNSVQSK
mmetsp:Transcript_1743/g.4053  ORF Transcript_1743/g.4053 Transcript_1743/m.4053 type:complete len:93 (+) Transcript_1743:2223-2501(+)